MRLILLFEIVDKVEAPKFKVLPKTGLPVQNESRLIFLPEDCVLSDANKEEPKDETEVSDVDVDVADNADEVDETVSEEEFVKLLEKILSFLVAPNVKE
ncbi:unnamed protein product [[Candida] boidinii]|nr:unnamed protein product [[Candida] boidinii]